MIKSIIQVKRGRYGSSKAKCFANIREGQWYPARQLCITTGISYPSLGRALSRWDRFEYVVRRDILIGGRYEYQLAAKGRRWLHLAALYLPHYKIFVAELKAWQANLPNIPTENLLNLPFKPFIATLDDIIDEFKKNNGKGA